MIFRDLEYLKACIKEDLDTKSNRRVRLVNVENMEEWIKIKDFIAGFCSNHFLLSQYCSAKDLTPKLARLFADLRTTNVNSIVLPISEHIRINKGITEQIVDSIINLDNNMDNNVNNIRIYFPMYRMKSTLDKISQCDARFSEFIWFLGLESDDHDYSLTIMPSIFSIRIDGNNLYGYRDYLAYWESNPFKPIILHTDNALYYKDNVYSDNVIVLATAFDILKYHKIVNINVEERYGSERDWDILLKEIGIYGDLQDFLKKYFSVGLFDSNELVLRFSKEKTEFGRWLAWLWLKIEVNSGYLQHCLIKSQSPTDFISEIINSIFDFSPMKQDYWTIYRERKELLGRLLVKSFKSDFWDKLRTVSSNKAIYYLSDLTNEEKCEIVTSIANIQLSSNYKEILSNIYPDLYAYISDYSSKIPQIDEYFNEYRLNKLTNTFPTEFVEKVNLIGKERGLWWKKGIISRNSAVDKLYNRSSLIFYIDSLGAEFCPFINHLLNIEHPSLHFDVELTYVNLPTITECNKEFVINRNAEPRIPDLDEVKHFGSYPSYIPEELLIIREILEKAVDKLYDYDRVIITSDHGSSRGFVLAKGESIKAKNGVKGERDGRFCLDSTTAYENELACCIDSGHYHVMTNYDRFSVSGASKNENHGGAALEEVLVPVIVLSGKPLLQKIQIIDNDTGIRPRNGIVHVTFTINVEAESVVAIVNGERYVCVLENGRYFFDAPVSERTEYTAHIICNGNSAEFKYTVQKGIKSNFDI